MGGNRPSLRQQLDQLRQVLNVDRAVAVQVGRLEGERLGVAAEDVVADGGDVLGVHHAVAIGVAGDDFALVGYPILFFFIPHLYIPILVRSNLHLHLGHHIALGGLIVINPQIPFGS